MKRIEFSADMCVTFRITVPDDFDETNVDSCLDFMYDSEDYADPEIMSYHELR